MHLVSYNVNGIRAAIRKGLDEWIINNNFDIICFQETKAQADQVDLSKLESLGYHAHWYSAGKKGYSGVLTLSKEKPRSHSFGMGIEDYDSEGRVLRTDYKDFSILNCYFPSGSSGEVRHAFKLKFLEDFIPFIEKIREQTPNLIVVGDYNIVHGNLDIHNPNRKDNPSGFRPEERKWMDKWFEESFDDVFRLIHPQKQEFSWWSYRAGSRERNKGWRIDYISTTKNLSKRVTDSGHFSDAMHSDHCPVWVNLKV